MPTIIKVLLNLAALLVFVVALGFVVSRLIARRRGYWVTVSSSKSSIQYSERVGKAIRKFTLPGETIEYGHTVYQPLSDEEWLRQVPDWALQRKQEIERRILWLTN